jgi:hypothetical protein
MRGLYCKVHVPPGMTRPLITPHPRRALATTDDTDDRPSPSGCVRTQRAAIGAEGKLMARIATDVKLVEVAQGTSSWGLY